MIFNMCVICQVKGVKQILSLIGYLLKKGDNYYRDGALILYQVYDIQHKSFAY